MNDNFQALQVYNYEGAQVQTLERDNDVWFVARDVANILGVTNIRESLRNLDDDEKEVIKIYSPDGIQEVTIINDFGVYTLILRSNKPEAKKFRRWITHDVLPLSKRMVLL